MGWNHGQADVAGSGHMDHFTVGGWLDSADPSAISSPSDWLGFDRLLPRDDSSSLLFPRHPGVYGASEWAPFNDQERGSGRRAEHRDTERYCELSGQHHGLGRVHALFSGWGIFCLGGPEQDAASEPRWALLLSLIYGGHHH